MIIVSSLDEADHCLVAVLGEAVIVTDLDVLKYLVRLNICWLIKNFNLLASLGIEEGVSCKNGVPKVSDKAHPIVKLDHQGLLVEHIPMAANRGTSMLCKVTVVPGFWTLNCLHVILVNNLNLPDFLVRDVPLIVISNNLHLVGMRVATNLFYFI